MNTNKMMQISMAFVLTTMLLFSGNVLAPSFAQSDSEDETNGGSEDKSNTGDDTNNSDKQNYDDFQKCLDDNAGTSGFATEQQIKDCFNPIYMGSSSSDSGSSDSGSSDSGSSDSGSSDSGSSDSGSSDSN